MSMAWKLYRGRGSISHPSNLLRPLSPLSPHLRTRPVPGWRHPLKREHQALSDQQNKWPGKPQSEPKDPGDPLKQSWSKKSSIKAKKSSIPGFLARILLFAVILPDSQWVWNSLFRRQNVFLETKMKRWRWMMIGLRIWRDCSNPSASISPPPNHLH